MNPLKIHLLMGKKEASKGARCQLDVTAQGIVTFYLSGCWNLGAHIPDYEFFLDKMARLPALEECRIGSEQLKCWDSSLLAFLHQIYRYCRKRSIWINTEMLDSRVRQMLEMAEAFPEHDEVKEEEEGRDLREITGLNVLRFLRGIRGVCHFIGELTISFFRAIRGIASTRGGDVWLIIEDASVYSLPIVGLISFLVGLIIAFLGAVVLIRFGAEFAISYLIGYGMLREMGAVMAGVIMAGRTGSSYAAKLGSMKVSEEIDALRTMGISPMDYLVLPRVLALAITMPLLTIYANVIGIFGGYLVATGMLDIPTGQFFDNMNSVIEITDVGLGVFKGFVFGLLISISGCLRGFQCKSSADDVGKVTTSAVVTGITLIIFANAIIDWIAAFYDI